MREHIYWSNSPPKRRSRTVTPERARHFRIPRGGLIALSTEVTELETPISSDFSSIFPTASSFVVLIFNLLVCHTPAAHVYMLTQCYAMLCCAVNEQGWSRLSQWKTKGLFLGRIRLGTRYAKNMPPAKTQQQVLFQPQDIEKRTTGDLKRVVKRVNKNLGVLAGKNIFDTKKKRAQNAIYRKQCARVKRPPRSD